MDGMIRELSVVKPPGAPVRSTLPSTEVSLKLFEWNFTLDGPLFAGRRTIRVENIGKFEHHVWIVRLNPNTTIEQAVKWAENPLGPAPFEPVGGTTGLGPGRAVNIAVDLLPGFASSVRCSIPLSKKTLRSRDDQADPRGQLGSTQEAGVGWEVRSRAARA
jgi:hypothetical protein